MCLPSTCSLDEVEHMAALSQKSLSSRFIEMISVRSPTEDPYEYWNDTTFIILV